MHKRRQFFIIFGIWTIVGLFFASQVYFDSLLRDRPVPLAKALVWQLTAAFILALATPLVLWLARRFPIARHNWQARLPLHLFASLVFAVVLTYLHVANDLFHARGAAVVTFSNVARFTFVMLDKDILVYWVILLINHAVNYYTRYQNSLLRASQLETRLAHAQLQALKMQLNPHFLFNTLNSIAELIHKDPDVADEMITGLSDMLRATLDKTGVQEVTLKQELEFLERYLAIERIRMGSRLRIKLNIEPETLDARVPNMILQPIIENAVRHGIAPCADGGEIHIEAARAGETLRLHISDTGRGLPSDKRLDLQNGNGNANSNVLKNIGVGLTNTRARLAHLYNGNSLFELRPATPHGLTVCIHVPFAESSTKEDDLDAPSLNR